MAFTSSELDLIEELHQSLMERSFNDELNWRYVHLKQRVQHLGMAIPPNMRNFLVVSNWPRVVVKTIASRQKLRSVILPGADSSDPQLVRIFDANNTFEAANMHRQALYTFGRSYWSVGANERDPSTPLIRVESPRQIEVKFNARTEEVEAAVRFYDYMSKTGTPQRVTLYLPNVTIHGVREGNGQWVEDSRDQHNLGVVPIIPHLNNREPGSFEGETELTDIKPLTDAVARALTNMQFTQEAHGAPRMWMTGVSKGEFIGADGKPIPQFEAYFDAIQTLSSKDAKIGQLDAADLSNFETAMSIYGKQAALLYGFPAKYFGITTANPATEGAIRADESELVNYVEAKNASESGVIGSVARLAYRFSTGIWLDEGMIGVEYFDPATPTLAQRMDALVKLRSVGAVSLRGVWTELGWSERRMERELEHLAAESQMNIDPYLANMMSKTNADPEPTQIS